MSAIGSMDLDLAVPRFDQPALCAEIDPDMFFADEHGGRGVADARRAKKVCGGCLARHEWLRWALDHDERYGIWGGLSPKERRRIVVAAARAAAA